MANKKKIIQQKLSQAFRGSSLEKWNACGVYGEAQPRRVRVCAWGFESCVETGGAAGGSALLVSAPRCRVRRRGQPDPSQLGEPAAAASRSLLRRPRRRLRPRTHIVKSPIVGTFYASPSPDSSRSFVKVGDRVKKGQVVCIIEAMKLMNEIEADVTGEIVRVLVENGQPVEYGQRCSRCGRKEKA